MTTHRFALGQSLLLAPGKMDRHIPGGTYTVVRLLPGEANDREYRLKHGGDGHERVMRESQLLEIVPA